MSFAKFGESDAFDSELGIRSNKILSIFLVEGKPFNIEIVFDPCFRKHRNVLKLQKETIVHIVIGVLLELSTEKKTSVEHHISDLQTVYY